MAETISSEHSANETFHRSPPLGIVAIVFVLLFFASIPANIMMTGGAPFPIPYHPIEQSQDYYMRFPDAMRVTAFLQFGAAIPIGIFTATVVSRLLFHGITVAGVYIALCGGLASALFSVCRLCWPGCCRNPAWRRKRVPCEPFNYSALPRAVSVILRPWDYRSRVYPYLVCLSD